MGGQGVGAPARIIPARAGFTTRPARRPTSQRDHPRTRGVYASLPSVSPGAGGSSPHARGLRTARTTSGKAGTDHPRTRGVYPDEIIIFATPQGSSPHARGLQAAAAHRGDDVRIIPARAGFTPTHAWPSRSSRDHPRTRGVYDTNLRPFAAELGSSPHARGLRQVGQEGPARCGIIPARAGFTAEPYAQGYAQQDHPRTRGVYGVVPGGQCAECGSSPHARGLPAPRFPVGPSRGIIPARAGFTLRRPKNT